MSLTWDHVKAMLTYENPTSTMYVMNLGNVQHFPYQIGLVMKTGTM